LGELTAVERGLALPVRLPAGHERPSQLQVLNGMSVRVAHGQFNTTCDGAVDDTLYITDFRGRKVRAPEAELP
jgi:hypothetical protein